MGAFICSVLAALPAFARASEADDAPQTSAVRSRVALTKPPGRAPAVAEATRRIRAEIEAAGFEVAEVTPAAGERSAFARITLAEDASGPRADVSLFLHPDAALSAVLRIDAADLEREGAAAGLAIRVVERLRASVVEIAREERVARTMAPDLAAWAGVKAPPDAPPPPQWAGLVPLQASPSPAAPPEDTAVDVPAPAPAPAKRSVPARPETWLGAGVSSLFSFGGLGPALGPMVHVRRDLPERFSIGATAAAPFGLVEVESRSGTAAIRQALVLATADRAFGPVDWILSPRMTVGVGAHVLSADGAADGEGLRSHSGQIVAFAAAANGGIGVRVAEGVRFTADFWTVLVLPEPVVVMDGSNAARAGLPMLGFSAGMEAAP